MHDMTYSCVIGVKWGNLLLCHIGCFILVSNATIYYCDKWDNLSLGAKWGDYKIMSIWTIFGSWYSCISYIICIKFIFLFIYICIWFLTFIWLRFYYFSYLVFLCLYDSILWLLWVPKKNFQVWRCLDYWSAHVEKYWFC